MSIDKLAATDWKAETGFTGQVSFTPWNEPNNPAKDGDGLDRQIPPRLAARYYLALVRACHDHGCKVGAGDFASNGTMWNDYEFNCANDNVAPGQLCKQKSSVNTANKPASYLDQYKNEIANHAKEYGLPAGFRPPYFAFHGWHDVNDYLNDANHCSTYGTCLVRRITKSLGGSWSGVALWNTEAGVGQMGTAPDDHDDHCTAAFLLRINTVTSRIKRLYVTRVRGGVGSLTSADHVPRPALTVLATRAISGAGCN